MLEWFRYMFCCIQQEICKLIKEVSVIDKEITTINEEITIINEEIQYLIDNPTPGPQGPAGPEGPQGSQGEQGEQGETGPQGPPGISCCFVGCWVAHIDYEINNSVIHKNGVYKCLLPNKNHPPLDCDCPEACIYWKLIGPFFVDGGDE